jgi:hypothetical protein
VVVLGRREAAFDGSASKTKLRLVDNTPVGRDGIVILTYEPVCDEPTFEGFERLIARV